MSDNSKIEWCDASWNPITGCEPISDGCANCYAHRLSSRFPAVHGAGIPFDRAVFHGGRIGIPLRWRKPRRIFVCSMGDLFYREVPSDWRCEVWSIMERCPQHTFMILTKRPSNIDHQQRPILDNVWIGVTAENQEQANDRIPPLMSVPAALRFVSVEPMLGPVYLTEVAFPFPNGGKENVLRCGVSDRAKEAGIERLNGIDWVICGGETGPKSRIFQSAWGKVLAYQCQQEGVPFFFKKPGNNYSCEERTNVEHSDWLRREFPKK